VLGRISPDVKQKTLQSTPLQDFTYPEDQADAVVFLASERARMITGTTLLVDGGISLPIGYVEWENFRSDRKQWLKEKKWEGKQTSM
ncbi:MAG: SDR family oxidoreductase, partial [Dehalococcoidales bacterium]